VFYFSAPWIADFYKTPELKSIVRVSSLTYFFNAVNAIQGAELTKKMLFHLSFRISLISCITSSICGVTLASLGFGVWAIVWTSLITSCVNVVSKWFIIAWRPKLMFSFARLKPLFSYGWKMSVSGLLDTFFCNINSLLIGKFYTKSDLAFVNKGRTLPSFLMSMVDGTLGRVTFPALVLMQDDRVRLRETMRRMMRCSTFLVFPAMVALAICARGWLRMVYGPQWTPAAPYMMLACFTFALWPFHTINLKGIEALGRSDVFLVLEIIKKVLVLVVVLSCFRLGVLAWMAISAFALGPLGVVINSWPNRKLLDYTIGMQVKDVLPTALVCCAQAAVMLLAGVAADVCAAALGLGTEGVAYLVFLGIRLSLQGVLGGVTFFGLSFAFRLNPMAEYARMGAAAINGRFPRLAKVLEKRFEGSKV
jgi:O-antigen/teichoic acid export membrane protein